MYQHLPADTTRRSCQRGLGGEEADRHHKLTYKLHGGQRDREVGEQAGDALDAEQDGDLLLGAEEVDGRELQGCQTCILTKALVCVSFGMAVGPQVVAPACGWR